MGEYGENKADPIVPETQTKNNGDSESCTTTRPPCQTFVLFDLETTGLSEADRITELGMVAVHRDELLTWPEKRPRVVNKLSVCVYPMRPISYDVERLTGLSNTNLEKQMDFNSDLVLLIKLFLRRLDPPVCLIAHNGKRFDFPHFMREVSRFGGDETLPDDLVCIDSLHMFRYLEEKDGITTDEASSSQSTAKLSFKLGDIFERKTGSRPAVSHGAEADSITLMALLQIAGKPAMDWIDSHATLLSKFIRDNQSSPVKGDPSLFPYQR